MWDEEWWDGMLRFFFFFEVKEEEEVMVDGLNLQQQKTIKPSLDDEFKSSYKTTLKWDLDDDQYFLLLLLHFDGSYLWLLIKFQIQPHSYIKERERERCEQLRERCVKNMVRIYHNFSLYLYDIFLKIFLLLKDQVDGEYLVDLIQDELLEDKVDDGWSLLLLFWFWDDDDGRWWDRIRGGVWGNLVPSL